MTEEEWLKTSNPTAMLEDAGLINERKFRLFAVACCRRIWAFLPEKSRQAVVIAERFADQHTSADELIEANRSIEPLNKPQKAAIEDNPALEASSKKPNTTHLVLVASEVAATGQVGEPKSDVELRAWEIADEKESQAQADLLRDIFGNPFRPVTLDPRWQSETIVSLANGIYTDRAFDRMPILADALEEAGCDNAVILNHCRGVGPHVRGCWVVDLVLGKE